VLSASSTAPERAGIRPGDLVIEVDGAPVRDVAEMSARTAPRAGEPTTCVVKRDDASLRLTITPQPVNGRGTIGERAKILTHTAPLSLGAAAAVSVGLGLFNLLPLPFLDGGRLIFLGVELVTGLLLLGAAIAVTWRDIAG
jgi:membrane-associated protease RseP (regulator of RpoE activity)